MARLDMEEVRIRVVKKEVPPGECMYAMGDTSPRPTFQLETAHLTYNNHEILPTATARINESDEVTAKAYIRDVRPTPNTAFKAMLMLTQVESGNEYTHKRSSAYTCYEGNWVYFDIMFLMPAEDMEVKLRAYYTNSRDCFQDISDSFYLKVAKHGDGGNEEPSKEATIECTTVPSDAMIYLDGMDMGQTPATITTTVGDHYIVYRKGPNYINYEVMASAIEDKAIRIAADLEEGTTAKEYWETIKDTIIPVEVAMENTCAHPWCLENMGKWVKAGDIGLDYPFTHKGTNFCILLDLSAGNPLPEFIYCPFRSVRFEAVGPSSHAIPSVIATESINKLLQEKEARGAVLLSESEVAHTLYPGRLGTFDIAVLNAGTGSTKYKVSVTFARMGVTHEEVFASDWSEAIAPGGTVTLPVEVELSTEAIPAGQETASYSISTTLEAV